MDGWMDGWIDGWIDGLMDGWMDGQLYIHTLIYCNHLFLRVQFKKHLHEGREGEDSDKEENTLSSSPQEKKLPETPPYINTQKATSSQETVILHPHLMFHLSKGKGQDHKKYGMYDMTYIHICIIINYPSK